MPGSHDFSIDRVIVPVGGGEGTGTKKARGILSEIPKSHGEIEDDPAPVATIEEFGDKSRNLILRAYFATSKNRLGVITVLHTEIEEKFSEAGIEIAFPRLGVQVTGQVSDESSVESVTDP